MGEDKEVTDKELERITKKVSKLEQQKIEKKQKFFVLPKSKSKK